MANMNVIFITLLLSDQLPKIDKSFDKFKVMEHR